MTRQKAVECLKRMYKKSSITVDGGLKCMFVNHDKPENTAIDMAIKALRERPREGE